MGVRFSGNAANAGYKITTGLPAVSDCTLVLFVKSPGVAMGAFDTVCILANTTGGWTSGHWLTLRGDTGTACHACYSNVNNNPQLAFPANSIPAIAGGVWSVIALTASGTRVFLYWKLAGAPQFSVLTLNTANTFTPGLLAVGNDTDGDPTQATVEGLKFWSGVALTPVQLEHESRQQQPVTPGVWEWWSFRNDLDRTGRTSRQSLFVVQGGTGSDETPGQSAPVRPSIVSRRIWTPPMKKGNPTDVIFFDSV
jgi:hypothetical protein